MSTPALLLRIALVPVLVAAVYAQETTAPSETQSVIVNVLDRSGMPIRDLTKESFVARVNGKPVDVLNARYSVAPRRIVILLDRSGSMTGQKSVLSRLAAKELASQVTDVPIAVLAFADKTQVIIDFSQSHAAIAQLPEDTKQKVKLSSPKGRTALYQAVVDAVRFLNPAQPGDIVYAITDGGDNASQSLVKETELALAQSGVRLFGLLLVDQRWQTAEERIGVATFVALVDGSGGIPFGESSRPLGGKPLDDLYAESKRERIREYSRDLNLLLRDFWELEVTSPATNKQSKFKLEITGSNGKARSDVQLVYPRLLAPTK